MNQKVITMCATGVLLGALAIGGTFAYLTDNETTTNNFTVGHVQIDLIESNKPDPTAPIIANEELKKNPLIKNTGANEAIVFMEFDIPMKDVITVEADGTRNPEEYTELFDFSTEAGTYDSTGSHWILLSEGQDDETNPSKKTYVYGYEQKLDPNESTTALFDKVRFANVIEGQVVTKTKTASFDDVSIPVRAYAIQSNYVNNIDTTSDTLNKATLQAVYTVFANQNDGDTLKDADINGEYDLSGK